MIKQNIIMTIFLLLMPFQIAYAKDFGVRGHTYQIQEQGFLEMIVERLQKVDIEKEQQKMQQIAQERVENPIPVEDVAPATSSRVFYYDPTYILGEDAVLPCGTILHKKGTRVNPLERTEFGRRLLFVDGRAYEQIKWLKAKLQAPKSDCQDKIILIGGSPLKLQETLNMPVYFDQGGMLVTKFGIRHSPAILEQEDLHIKIEEFVLGK
jgi:conjugal transfer pilus assembly protein TraW